MFLKPIKALIHRNKALVNNKIFNHKKYRVLLNNKLKDNNKVKKVLI